MREVSIKVYRLSELQDKAKAKALNYLREIADYAWSDESADSLKAFCEYFCISHHDLKWQVGAYSPVCFSYVHDNGKFRGLRLRDFNRDLMLTGYCLDCDFMQAFCDEFKATGDAKKAFNSAIYSGLKAWRDDMEHCMSDEYLAEHAELNDYEFTEDGKIFA